MSRRSLVKRVSVAVALVVPLSVGTVLTASPAQASTDWTISGATQYTDTAAAAELPSLELECRHEGGSVVKEVVNNLVIDDGGVPAVIFFWGEVWCRPLRSVG
jgi:hypothetical protein